MVPGQLHLGSRSHMLSGPGVRGPVFSSVDCEMAWSDVRVVEASGMIVRQGRSGRAEKAGLKDERPRGETSGQR